MDPMSRPARATSSGGSALRTSASRTTRSASAARPSRFSWAAVLTTVSSIILLLGSPGVGRPLPQDQGRGAGQEPRVREGARGAHRPHFKDAETGPLREQDELGLARELVDVVDLGSGE